MKPFYFRGRDDESRACMADIRNGRLAQGARQRVGYPTRVRWQAVSPPLSALYLSSPLLFTVHVCFPPPASVPSCPLPSLWQRRTADDNGLSAAALTGGRRRRRWSGCRRRWRCRWSARGSSSPPGWRRAARKTVRSSSRYYPIR